MFEPVAKTPLSIPLAPRLRAVPLIGDCNVRRPDADTDSADLTERVSANVHRAGLQKGSATGQTSGSVHYPMTKCRGAEGGVRARMKQEDEGRERQLTPASTSPRRLR
jgi:hypothetical protein